MFSSLLKSFVVLVVGTAQASAAVLYVNEGAASVGRGQGFVPAVSGDAVGAGDKVVVSTGGSATIVYAPGCEVKVGSGEVVTVAAEAPCMAAAQGGAAGDAAGAAGAAGLGIGTSGLLIGGLVVAGGVGIAVGLSGGGGNNGHSP